MRKFLSAILVMSLMGVSPAFAQQTPKSTTDATGTTDLRQEVDQLKKTISMLEQRLAAQEQKAVPTPAPEAMQQNIVDTSINSDVKDLSERLGLAERKNALDRLNWSGDYRFQTYSYTSNIPSHFDGMQLQNLVVRSMFYMQTNQGQMPSSVSDITNNVAAHYSDYLLFTNNLKFSDLRAAMAQFPPAMQQQLMGMLMPATYVKGYTDNNRILYTNRLRLNFDTRVSDNVSVTARLSMYKAFGDSTGVQVFDGQPQTMAIDGTTARVPSSDLLRVERAYFTWNKIGGTPLYLSIGRRPSTEGPPMQYREDEARGGTPSGALIDYQFDGITVGYHVGEKMALRACYGLGYESGYGNGDTLRLPADRLKDVHLFGANADLYTTDKSLVQLTVARAWNVTDGFNGEVVLPVNPITGDAVGAPVIMRYTPSVNLGAINLYGLNLTHRLGPMDFYGSMNLSATRPNGESSPFGGLMSDPFDTPVNHSGHMVLVGARFNLPKNDGRTKIGFEFNQGSKYWFNFAQAADDIIAPKTATRGEVYETYITHRISDRFILRGGYQRYGYTYSGSGWHVGAPKKLSETPVLGFPTYEDANVFQMALIARF
jgi:hypothetical protein